MALRVTLQDIARAAGVSPATVDRVLNQREGVRKQTRAAVMGVAQQLGYDVPKDSAPLQTGVIHNLVFLLPSGTNTFIKTLGRQIEQQAANRPDVRVRVETLEGFNPQSVARRLAELQGKISGIGLIAQDHPLVRDAIQKVVRDGVAVVTLASDIQSVPRLAYVGIDNRQAGRLAGHLMGRLLGGQLAAKVALFSGSLSYRGHEEREMGFRNILREEYPGVQIIETREVLDDRTRAEAEAAAVLTAHPDLRGIYNIGGGTHGIALAIRARAEHGRITVIAHEATEGNKQLLLEGVLEAVIDQNPRVEAREALNLLTAAATGAPYTYVQPRIQVIFKENLPEE